MPKEKREQVFREALKHIAKNQQQQPFANSKQNFSDRFNPVPGKETALKNRQRILDYLDELIKQKNRGVQWLRSDVADNAIEKPEIIEKINYYKNVGAIEKEESEKLLGMLK